MGDQRNDIGSFFVWGVLFIVFMVAVTIFYFNYDFPNKNVDRLESFFWIFFKEILAFILVVVVFMALLISKIYKYFKSKSESNA